MANASFDFTNRIPDNTERMNYTNDYSVAKMGAVYKGTNHMGKLIAFEPQRLYNFELQIVGLDNLYTADNAGTDNGTYSGLHFGSAAERILVACSSFSVPNTEFGTIEIPHYNNTTKYAGKVSFGNATLKVEQFLGSFTEQIMTAWSRCVYDPRTQNIGYKADYAKDMYVIQYDSKGGTPRVWKMENAWPAVLPGADWDYNSTDRRQMSFNIVCDRCVPDYAIDTRTFSTVNNDAINSITHGSINSNSPTSKYATNLAFNMEKNKNWTYDASKGGYLNPETGETIPAYSNLSPATGNK